MPSQKPGLLGRKIGMTQLFDQNGAVQGVTVVEIEPNRVLQVKSTDGADGYTAAQLAIGAKKAVRSTKAELGHARKALGDEAAAPRHVQEVRLSAEDAARYPLGGTLGATDFFAVGDKVDVQGLSKGRGFTGVMKRHNFSGFKSSHGVHEYYRHGGSIGTRLTPGMTFKGVGMPGRHGNSTVSVQSLKVVRIDAERNLVYILGGVPGPNGATVLVRKAVKG